MYGEEGALLATATIVKSAPNMDAKFYAATHVPAPSDEILGVLALRLEAATKEGDTAQLKKLLKVAIRTIEVQSRALVQPYFKCRGFV